MIKINLSTTTVENFKKQILSNFFDTKDKPKLYKKVEKKKEKWAINIQDINSIIKKKLKGYSEEIDLKELITMDVKELSKLKSYIDDHKAVTSLNTTEKDYFYTLYTRLKKATYIQDLDITVCPYCNRNYIQNFTRKNSLEATAQLDHFFDKKTYPYFAVSIYNLVPSCQTCNQRKSTKQNEIYHPFVESLSDDLKFQLIVKDYEFLYNENSIDIEKKVLNNHNKVESHIETFNIDNLYKNHKDIILELIQKAEIYNDSYIDELFNHYEGTLFKNREDLMRLITCGYITDEEINKRPLSKLIKDISEELEL